MREHARARERVAARQVAEAVRDQAAPVPLDSAQDVRARGEHEISAGVDHRVRELGRVSARLAEVASPSLPDTWSAVDPSAPACM